MWILYRLLCRGIHCLLWSLYYLLCGLCAKLSTFKMKATFSNANTTAPATPLCCIYHYLSYLCLCKISLPFLGSNLDSLTASYLSPPGGTVIPVTRCPTGILASNHTDKRMY
jgi:hypothetical protein